MMLPSKPQPAHLKDGINAEELAATFLRQNGLKLITRNFRSSYGEIDLVMQDGKTTVFIEVRLRSSYSFGGAAMSITPSKQQKIRRTAECYLQRHGEQLCRFDAVLMDKIDINAVEWIQNAF